MTFYSFFKTLAFRMDPERAHNLSLNFLGKFPDSMSEMFGGDDRTKDKLNIVLKCGLSWPNPIGLAAGLDKNAEAIDFFSQIPFGAIEVGTVTPLPQEGNPKPRMFRLVEEESLLNRMGFNNGGAQEVHRNILKANKHNKVLGINLGKNKVTPADKACEDYQKLYKTFHDLSDYLVINVSSPNTPGLRDLQREEGLREIFGALDELRDEKSKPLFLKIAPDLSFDDLDPVLKVAHDYKLAGIIATNTTIMPDKGQGGISGRLLKQRSQAMRKEVLTRMGEDSPLDLIGVGGISTFDELWDFWKLGGRAAQVYTSFIYHGPQMLNDILKKVEETIEYNDFKDLNEMIKNIKEAKRL